MKNPSKNTITSVWISPVGEAHVTTEDGQGNAFESVSMFQPFCWASDLFLDEHTEGVEVEELVGDLPYKYRITFDDLPTYYNYIKAPKIKNSIVAISSLEHQFLLQNNARLYEEISFKKIRRSQLDIETYCSVEGSFCSAQRKGDRILAIGFQCSKKHMIVLEEMTDEAERKLLERFNEILLEEDPDIIEGHNIFNFDLNYLVTRAKMLGVPCRWGRFGQDAFFRKSRMRIAERMIDFMRCDIPGRTIFDTYLMIQIYDLTERSLSNYSLKTIAREFGISTVEDRTYLEGSAIQNSYFDDRQAFLSYLSDDLRETAGVANILLPTYVAQVKNFPMTLQEVTLRGTAMKIDLMFLEKYYQAGHSLPIPMEVKPFAGGYTKSFEVGVYKDVLHYDVASLYPSILLNINKKPENDHLNVFIPILKELKEYRLKYKKLAKEESDPDLKKEYEARQTSYKILINTFYGYLGFSGARFCDGKLAAEVTEKGRDLLQKLIQRISEEKCSVLEADTDGIYLSSSDYFDKPEALLDKIKDVLPEGVNLEYDGKYVSMFCYKAKNYAIYDGNKVIVRGSGLRSRGQEKFLKRLTHALIDYLLGVKKENPLNLLKEFEEKIVSMQMDINLLCKREYLSQNPKKYLEDVEKKGKSRRASLEVALKMKKVPTMGSQVIYYITQGEKKRMPDWQVARAVEDYDPQLYPYNPDYYLKKLKDWKERYINFLEEIV